MEQGPVDGEAQIQQLQELFNGVVMDNSSPFELLMRMRQLNNNIIPDDLLRIIWLRQVPEDLKVLCSDSLPLDEQARALESMQKEKKLMEQTRKINDLEKKLKKARQKIAKMEKQQECRCPCHCPHNSAADLQLNDSRCSSPEIVSNLCYYHLRFGDHARYCVSPCARRSEN